jgi:predicted nucleic acid-binding protein
MKKIFIDTNILLDVFLNRESFADASTAVFADCESGKSKDAVSAISLDNLHYILSRHIGKSKALEAVRIVLNIFTVVPLDEKILHLAADLSHKDFEDAIQLQSAIRAGANCIITRDANHFPKDELPILAPGEYLELNP